MAKNIGAILFFLYLFLGILGLWFIYAVSMFFMMDKITALGPFGDSFGALNTLFSGMAFAALVYTILLQQKQIQQVDEQKLQDIYYKELSDLKDELKSISYTDSTIVSRPIILHGNDAFKQYTNVMDSSNSKTNEEFELRVCGYIILIDFFLNEVNKSNLSNEYKAFIFNKLLFWYAHGELFRFNCFVLLSEREKKYSDVLVTKVKNNFDNIKRVSKKYNLLYDFEKHVKIDPTK